MLRLFDIKRGKIVERPFSSQVTEPDLAEVVWVDLQEPLEEERNLLEHLLRTELPESEEVDEIEASARYFVDDAGVHIHSLFLTQSEGRHYTATVAFILQPRRLITMREHELADFRLLRMRARRGQVEARSAHDLVVQIFEQKVEDLADTLEDIHVKLSEASFRVLEDEDSDLEDAIALLASLEDCNGKVLLCLMDTRRSIAFLQRHIHIDGEQRESLLDIIRDIDTLTAHTGFLFNKINFLMDSTQGFINIRQTNVIKMFSIAAVVFLPPTTVASIYGMNFEFIPELKWLLGYPFSLGLIVLSGLAPYLYFKKKGWL
ncbi:magnesium/cobalt transporter CorA [Microbulbifer thermotolerans]|uniref:Magnesium transport protein CorA n=1 Tax=Microbulbifer thermotolerans TaxID=252514 RepID=A0A143HNG5_MICTH|nr:magnesium/cobalt transporter CorA [Microbulbifer thermotolerans]AMX03275.1 magnesium transporter CorA [Microbulbifer thermotolerans]MCX2780861.1 magnesium/cobalt transporter CorA [Microbulbifer thermotolerans]MCX2784285.1 magnesium/cobalt transporter CorA [Microbulbifer thermotolerans]MCX2794360.1 magnesium/cobalt transporter CorA [Microbulbifer thermotolerans]MCX2801010.1 magnesium/cobalt transporter CorA [Microbulbifer thermotolerans]